MDFELGTVIGVIVRGGSPPESAKADFMAEPAL